MAEENDDNDRVLVPGVVPRTVPKGASVADRLRGVSESDSVAWDADEMDAETAEELAHPYGPHKDEFGRFKKGNSAASVTKGMPRKSVQFGVPVKAAKAADERFKALMLNAGRYRRARSAEVAAMHGMTTAGVNGMIAAASSALAASKFMYLRALEAAGPKEQREFLSLASKLANDARQLEVTAYDLAGKEAKAIQRQEEPDVPDWLQGTVVGGVAAPALERQAVENVRKAAKVKK